MRSNLLVLTIDIEKKHSKNNCNKRCEVTMYGMTINNFFEKFNFCTTNNKYRKRMGKIVKDSMKPSFCRSFEVNK